jgi:multiple sugar transport system substrate-binding protein
MSTDRTGSRGRHPSRRDFLATGARAGAGLALAGTGLEVVWRSADAGSITLTYIGLKERADPNLPIKLLKMFAQLHPGVQTQYVVSPQSGGADAYHDKLVTIFSAHDSSIDVADSDVIWQAQWAPAGWAVPLDKYFPREQQRHYVPAMIWADTIDNHIYGIPWLLDTGHLFYRKDILDANGLKPARTWQELEQQSLKLHKKYPNMVPFVACYNKGQQLICNFLEYAWTNGGDILDSKNNVVLNSPQNVEALQVMIDFIKKKIVQPGVVSMDLDVGRQIFTNGNAIYHRNWNYAYALSQANPKLVGKVGVTDIPTFPGHRTASCAGGWQYIVNNYSKNRDMAIKLAVFLGGPKMQKYRTLHGSTSAAYLSVNYDKDVVKKFPSYPLLAQQAKTARSRPKTPLWTHISQAAEAELTNALTGTKSPKKALDDATNQIKAILSGQQ